MEVPDFKLRYMRDAIYAEQNRVQDIIEISTIDEFNKTIHSGEAKLVIAVSEALQENHICRTANMINERRSRVVLVAGPSSSGKTTFSKRLSLQLLACGLRPYPISLDNYYLDRELCPKDEKGEEDFESLYALNIDLLNKQLTQLFNGEEVELPEYNFKEGKSILKTGKMFRMAADQVLVLEGIHGLNPELTKDVRPQDKFSIYVAPLTSMIGADGHHMSVTDKRLLRRIIRDYKYRGVTAEQTIHRWPSVRAGEEKWIEPFQGHADAMVNTSLLYEVPAIKSQAVVALNEVPKDCPEREIADRLLGLMEQLDPLDDHSAIPATSLLREFLGGSLFEE